MAQTNDDAIARWGAMPRDLIESMALDGDFAKRHLINPTLLRMLGDVRGRRILDAGAGNGYLCRILADRGADVVGVEPGRSPYDFCCEQEELNPQGVTYIRADLSALPEVGAVELSAVELGTVELGSFDAVVCSMVLPAIPDWRPAMRACVEALTPGGIFVFTVNHPCFESLLGTWREHGAYRTEEYLAEYPIEGRSGTDFHRTTSTYLNELIGLGAQICEIAEPGLDPAEATGDGLDAYVHLPNFLIVAARRNS